MIFQGKPVFRTGLTVSDRPAQFTEKRAKKVFQQGSFRQVVRKWGAVALMASGLAAGGLGTSAAWAKGPVPTVDSSTVMLGTLPVSYTHLTLPTKRIV